MKQDDRTEEQKKTHTWLVIMTDRFMSGWGLTEGGVSYAAWACRPEILHEVEKRIRRRKDASRVRIAFAATYRPKLHAHDHFHIYVCNAGQGVLYDLSPETYVCNDQE